MFFDADPINVMMTSWHGKKYWRFVRGLQWSPNTLRPKQNGCHFPDDSFKWIFLNENVWISIEVSLKFVSKGPINNIPALVQIMAWRRPGAKPLSEPMMVSLLTHICVTRPQWVKKSQYCEALVFCLLIAWTSFWTKSRFPVVQCAMDLCHSALFSWKSPFSNN